MADPASKPPRDEGDKYIREAEAIAASVRAFDEANPRKHAPPPKLPIPAAPTAKVYQLPLWPEPVRGAPNSFLRSALFAAIQGKTRRYMEKALLASIQGVAVRFTGKQLDQSDLDVWEQAVHLARQHPLGNVCHVTIYAFLKALGRSTGKAATGIKGTINGDIVTVERHGSRAQLRHLRRKSGQQKATHGPRKRRQDRGWRSAGELIDGRLYPKE